ncbi:MAG: hypothetical protein IPK66_19075 [Rhodospirillales bacterium]|nr:hypothetical protein [Rhodospirillales bacterium]
MGSAGCGRAEPSDTPAKADATPPDVGKNRRPTVFTIEIVSGDRRWTARIDDTPAARDFLAQLPLKLTLKDFGGNEKIADLPRRLTREGAPDAITPRAGDVAFYAPWGNLAIFYGHGHHSPGLVPPGRIEGDVSALAGGRPVTVSIDRAATGG